MKSYRKCLWRLLLFVGLPIGALTAVAMFITNSYGSQTAGWFTFPMQILMQPVYWLCACVFANGPQPIQKLLFQNDSVAFIVWPVLVATFYFIAGSFLLAVFQRKKTIKEPNKSMHKSGCARM